MGRRPRSSPTKLFIVCRSHAVKLAPAPLSINPSPHTFDCLRRRSLAPRARGAAGCCCCDAAAGAAAMLGLTAAPVAPHRAPWAARLAARCCSASWADRLHVGGSHHIVMSPSDAWARVLTNDDQCHRGLFLLLWEAACGSCGHVVTWDTLVALVISLPMIEVGFCGADGHFAAYCTACIASARVKRRRGSQRPILRSSFCNGLRIHRSERCQCWSCSTVSVCGTAWLCALHTAMRDLLRPPAGGHCPFGYAASSSSPPSPPSPPPLPPRPSRPLPSRPSLPLQPVAAVASPSPPSSPPSPPPPPSSPSPQLPLPPAGSTAAAAAVAAVVVIAGASVITAAAVATTAPTPPPPPAIASPGAALRALGARYAG